MAVAFVVIGCKSTLKTTESFDISQVPVQVVRGMSVVQTDKGCMQMRAEAPVMERYQSDTLEWELFPEGFTVYAYNEQGNLETLLRADIAKHTKPNVGNEKWSAYGNVKVANLINGETMETDTLYWNRDKEQFYTDSYVQLYSPSGYMQGYGMESDQHARNSVILRPFNSYGIIQQDSTAVTIDSVNFIGPFPLN